MTRNNFSRRELLKAISAMAAVAALPARARSTPAGPVRRTRVRFGVTGSQSAPYHRIVNFWKEADKLGFDSAFVFDHFMPLLPNPTANCCFEAWTLLSALAAQTKRIRLGVLVSGNTYRHPTLVAKMAATVDHVSRGRLILGLGAAWMKREHDAYGIPFYTTPVRAHRLVEAVKVIHALFTQETSDFAGRYYTLRSAPFRPRPVQKPHPPILIGGMGPKVIQPLAARYAQIWHFGVPGNDPDKVRRVCASFDELCHRVGRDPQAVEKATSLDPRKLTELSSEDMRRHVRALAEAGVRHFIFLPLSSEEQRSALRRFAGEVLPHFRAT